MLTSYLTWFLFLQQNKRITRLKCMVDPTSAMYMRFTAQALEIYSHHLPLLDRWGRDRQSWACSFQNLAAGKLGNQISIGYFPKWVSESTSYSYWREEVSMVSAPSKSSSAWILAAHKDDKVASIDGFVAAVMVELVVARFLFAKLTWTENSE